MTIVINMIKDELYKIIHNFYPKGVDAVHARNEYIESFEYKNLLNLIDSYKKSANPQWVSDFLLKIKDASLVEAKDITLFSWNDRCYTLEFTLNLNKQIYQIKFYKSIIIPCYLIMCFKVNIIENRQKISLMSNDDCMHIGLAEKISSLAESRGFKKFNTKILFDQILALKIFHWANLIFLMPFFQIKLCKMNFKTLIVFFAILLSSFVFGNKSLTFNYHENYFVVIYMQLSDAVLLVFSVVLILKKVRKGLLDRNSIKQV
mgnify:CR=1 FL=1